MDLGPNSPTRRFFSMIQGKQWFILVAQQSPSLIQGCSGSGASVYHVSISLVLCIWSFNSSLCRWYSLRLHFFLIVNCSVCKLYVFFRVHVSGSDSGSFYNANVDPNLFAFFYFSILIVAEFIYSSPTFAEL